MSRTMNTSPTDSGHANFFDRLFGLEKHEYAAVGWSFLYFFCVLSSYYMLRPVRDEMAVYSGADTIPWLFMATFVVTLITTPVLAGLRHASRDANFCLGYICFLSPIS